MTVWTPPKPRRPRQEAAAIGPVRDWVLGRFWWPGVTATALRILDTLTGHRITRICDAHNSAIRAAAGYPRSKQ